jgi:hypothetical protein
VHSIAPMMGVILPLTDSKGRSLPVVGLRRNIARPDVVAQPLLMVTSRTEYFSCFPGPVIVDGRSQQQGPRTVDLRKRRPLRLLLGELVWRHTRGPLRPMTVTEAFIAAWPGQRVLPTIAMGRVQNAVCALRRMGLRGVLLSRAGGYMLDPRCLVVVDDELGIETDYRQAS